MKVLIHDELKSYMHQHNHSTIALTLVHSDYNGSNMHEFMPSISYHQPNNPDAFTEYQVDEFKVYVAKDIRPIDDTLEFKHDKLIGIHFCHVEGLNLSLK